MLLKLFSQVLHSTRYNCIYNSFSAESDYDCQILLCRILFAFTHLATLNSIGVLLKGVLIDLHARNFLHAKTSLRARCVHARDRARNLSSPGKNTKFSLAIFEEVRLMKQRWMFRK